ncbi:MAG TPA: response regulator [Calditrichia bacterium]|nr:response regulator [Calditrichota bacterium]HQU73370.1 response regulator [Calditrichia bacterium]HQV30604.1 response regulator [Calditrichia bacterium]
MAKKVLVVEDDETIAMLIKDVVAMTGAEALVAGTAREAEALLEENSMALAIVDLSLPDSTGLELCQEIDQKYPALTQRCILTSGYNAVGELASYLEASGNRFIQKPFPIMQLRDIVAGMLASDS